MIDPYFPTFSTPLVLPASVMQLIVYHGKVEVNLLNNENSVGFVVIYSLFVSLQPEIEICVSGLIKNIEIAKFFL